MFETAKRRPRQAIAIISFSMLCLAAMRSDLLLGYAYDLPVNPATERLVAVAEVWRDLAVALGLDAITQAVVEGVDRLRGTDNGL